MMVYFFLYYYMNKNRDKKFAQATRASAERRSGGLLYLLAKNIPNKKSAH